jgi:hypothetical protein
MQVPGLAVFACASITGFYGAQNPNFWILGASILYSQDDDETQIWI